MPVLEKRKITALDVKLLQALADGETLANVAKQRNRSHSTLKQQIYQIRLVMGADTTAQAIAMAFRRSLID